MSRSFSSVCSFVAFNVAVAMGFMAAVLTNNGAQAAPFAYTGGTYSQDFDSLASASQGSTPAWSDGVTLPGWYGFVGGATPLGFTTSSCNDFTIREAMPGPASIVRLVAVNNFETMYGNCDFYNLGVKRSRV